MTATELLAHAAAHHRRQRWLDRTLAAAAAAAVVSGPVLLVCRSFGLPTAVLLATCAATAAAAALAVRRRSVSGDLVTAARRADDRLRGAERFLTIATATDDAEPALEIVREQADSLVTAGSRGKVAERLHPSRAASAALVSGVVFLLLTWTLHSPLGVTLEPPSSTPTEDAVRRAMTGSDTDRQRQGKSRDETEPEQRTASRETPPTPRTPRPDIPWPFPSWLPAIFGGSGEGTAGSQDKGETGGGLKGPVADRRGGGSEAGTGSDSAPGTGEAHDPGAGTGGAGGSESGEGGPGGSGGQDTGRGKGDGPQRGESRAPQTSGSQDPGGAAGTREREVPQPEPAPRFAAPGAGTGGLREAGFVIVRVPGAAAAAQTGELVANEIPAVPTVPRVSGGGPRGSRPNEIGLRQHVPGEYREIIGGTEP